MMHPLMAGDAVTMAFRHLFLQLKHAWVGKKRAPSSVSPNGNEPFLPKTEKELLGSWTLNCHSGL